jgi:hypothetical protein
MFVFPRSLWPVLAGVAAALVFVALNLLLSYG